jgi:DNA ligase-associated metallophosphoesterase
MDSIEITIAQERLCLNADGSLFWPDQKALFIADFHLGKANHFRKAGIAIPLKVQAHNLARLEKCIKERAPQDIYFLGDLFHSELNATWELFIALLEHHPQIRFHLILGNHDILPQSIYKNSQLNIHQEGLILDPFILNHHPIEDADVLFSFCGHIHPAVRLKGKGRQSVKLNCFWKTGHQLILPAFGGFTGTVTIKPKEKDEVYIIINNSIRKA